MLVVNHSQTYAAHRGASCKPLVTPPLRASRGTPCALCGVRTPPPWPASPRLADPRGVMCDGRMASGRQPLAMRLANGWPKRQGDWPAMHFVNGWGVRIWAYMHKTGARVRGPSLYMALTQGFWPRHKKRRGTPRGTPRIEIEIENEIRRVGNET